jgi:hypothetical protein
MLAKATEGISARTVNLFSACARQASRSSKQGAQVLTTYTNRSQARCVGAAYKGADGLVTRD